MSLSIFAFWPLVALVVAGALSTALSRNLIYAAISLGVTLSGVAGLYFFLQAEFLAVAQLGVYVGGILVLILFGVMFSRDILGKTLRPARGTWFLGGLSAALTFFVAARVALAVAARRGDNALELQRSAPESWPGNFAPDSPAHLGDLLSGPYLVPFLVVAMLLTVILVGALVLVRKEGE